jgi:hypothetical protein
MGSRVEIALSTGHTAVIEVESDGAKLQDFVLGKIPELPPHPDVEAEKIAEEIAAAMRDDDGVHSFGVQVIGVRMVSALDVAHEFASGYRDAAKRILQRDQED